MTERRREGHSRGVRYLVVGLVVACGCGSLPTQRDADADVNLDATTVQDAGITFSDASTFIDASPEGSNVTLDGGGGPFLCHGCICDGTVSYCEYVWAGAGKSFLVDDAGIDASVCANDAGPSECRPFFSDCLPTPTCGCLLAHSGPGCECGVDTSGEGLVVECTLP